MITPANWSPSPGIDLEPNAEIGVRSLRNYLVVAGPGAGKTELLAQRAGFLLETNLCIEPRRILAISFKKDAADNLRARVESRIGSELAVRFDSHTFDSYGKSLLDRFREGITPAIRPPADYEIVTDFRAFADSQVSSMIKQATAADNSIARLKNLDAKWFLANGLCLNSLDAFSREQDEMGRLAKSVWLLLLQAQPCHLTFDMVKRLAERIIQKNDLLARALRITYDHVFLDEFQDTTAVQYDLLRASFPNGTATMTAVGDNKQRIMLWANAMPDAFDRFMADYQATHLQLLQNRRSDKRLVEIQRALISAIDPDCEPSEPAPDQLAGDGVCLILEFDDENTEANAMLIEVRRLIDNGIAPNDICFIVRQTAEKYVHKVIEVLNANGVKCRMEEPYQNLLRDELVGSILDLLHLALGLQTAKRWQPAIDFVCLLDGLDPDQGNSAYTAEEKLTNFVAQLKQVLALPVKGIEEIAMVLKMVISFLGKDKIRAHFPRYRQVRALQLTLRDFARLLLDCWKQEGSWKGALECFYGRDSVPAMTIHKSKGLEYHTVFFIGLEDSAWWNFAKQAEEETCAFFVAFSRAKKQIYFTFCRSRSYGGNHARTVQKRTGVGSLYRLLTDAGVEIQA